MYFSLMVGNGCVFGKGGVAVSINSTIRVPKNPVDVQGRGM